jgi:hypothetical protein
MNIIKCQNQIERTKAQCYDKTSICSEKMPSNGFLQNYLICKFFEINLNNEESKSNFFS